MRAAGFFHQSALDKALDGDHLALARLLLEKGGADAAHALTVHGPGWKPASGPARRLADGMVRPEVPHCATANTVESPARV